MRKKIKYLYTLERANKALRLTIPIQLPWWEKCYLRLVILLTCLAILGLLGVGFVSAVNWLYWALGLLFLGGFLYLVLGFLYLGKTGYETFTLYDSRIEYKRVNKPFFHEQEKYDFEKIEIGYVLDEDYFDEETENIVEIDFDLDKVDGWRSILFYLDGGKEILYSEEEIPIEVIRKIREEYKKLKV